MKNLKIITICLFISFISSAGIYAQQVKDTMSLLTQNEWTITHGIEYGDGIVSIINITETEYSAKSSYQDRHIEYLAKYYLSDNPETIFDYDKIGKVFDGRYMIMLNKDSTVYTYEIIKISETEFEYTMIIPNEQTRSSESRKTFIYQINPK